MTNVVPILTAQVETLKNGGLDEIKPLLNGHWEELALNKDKVPLDPQYDLYLKREELGEVLYVTLRSQGKLVGYFVGFIAPGLHYKTCLTLTMDIIYVHPDYRGTGGGLVLGKAIEREAKRRGVQRWFMGFKTEHKKHMEKLLQTLGMEQVEVFYSKWIGD